MLTVTPPTLPAGHVIETHIAGANNNLSYAAGCAIISRVVPTGGTPVSGNIISEVWREAEVITNTGQPYVQRHYQLTPAAGSTATVTLYYSQTEFDNFNAAPGSTLDLPANAGDATGKANLRVFKYSGSTSNGSGLPNTYTSGVTFINPDDVNIVWNATFNYWEVIFDVAGFSGFFIGTADLRYCPGSTITLSQAGTTFQWQSDNGTGSFSNLLNGGNYAGTGTGNLVISNIPGSFYNYKYRCLVNGSFYSEVITIKALVSWTGNTSTAWEDPLNWGCSVIPDINTDVLLVNNLSRYPVVNNNTTVRSLTVSPGASIIIATGVKLTINH